MIRTKTAKLVSSKIKKFVFPHNSTDETQGSDWKVGDEIEGHWEYVDDVNQLERLNNTYKITYKESGDASNHKLHSTDEAAIQSKSKDFKEKDYYLNGIKHSKDEWKTLVDDSKMEPLPSTDKVFGRN